MIYKIKSCLAIRFVVRQLFSVFNLMKAMINNSMIFKKMLHNSGAFVLKVLTFLDTRHILIMWFSTRS